MAAIPALDESSTIADVIAQTQAALPEATIVVIDDGSTDDTAAIAAQAGAIVLRLPFNVGVGGALRTAFLYAQEQGFDAVLQIDGDGQHDPSAGGALLEALSVASVAVGSRFLDDTVAYRVPRVRRWTMAMLAGLLSRVTATRLTDSTSGFRAADKAAIRLFADHYPVEYLGDTMESLVLAHRAGLTITEVPVRMRPRQGGAASQGPLRSILYLSRALLALSLALIRPRPEVAQ